MNVETRLIPGPLNMGLHPRHPGAIVLMVIFAFITLRHVQRKRRESLQRRLVSGEVDLEYLGIKRLVVPPHILSALPVYVYPGQEEQEAPKDEEKVEDICEERNDTEPKDKTTVTETEINETDSNDQPSNTHSTSTLTLVPEQDETISSIPLRNPPSAVPPRAPGKTSTPHIQPNTNTNLLPTHLRHLPRRFRTVAISSS